jgi:hypothetical protein
LFGLSSLLVFLVNLSRAEAVAVNLFVLSRKTDKPDEPKERGLELGGASGVGHGDDAMHDGMDATDIRILPRCEARNGKGTVW